MANQALIDWIEREVLGGKALNERDRESLPLLADTVERFSAHLRDSHGIERMEETTLEALRDFAFDLPANDDQHLRSLFRYYGRSDLLEHLSMVSADKYFRNKKLAVALKEVDALKGYVKPLREAGVRMASELLERGATPDGRRGLAAETSVPPEALLELVKCCDLLRMTGMAGKTLRRVMDMGYDTLAKFRSVEPEAIEAELADFLKQRGERTNRMVPYGSFVRQAHRLEDVIVY